MGPQLYRCGNLSNKPLGPAMPYLLQWGRNFIVAEISSLDVLGISRSMLQWGRNFIVAEIIRAYRMAQSTMHSFNGAATLSLRKSFLDCPYTFFVSALQWGRNFIVAEIRSLIRAHHTTRLCFNGAATLSLRKSVRHGTASPCTVIRFNGAATLSLRKYTLTLSSIMHRSYASMGPQLYRCGNPQVPCPSQGQNRASMGPQLYRCGNDTVLGRTVAPLALLQWGRNFIVAEIWIYVGINQRSVLAGFNGAATLSLRKWLRWNAVPPM